MNRGGLVNIFDIIIGFLVIIAIGCAAFLAFSYSVSSSNSDCINVFSYFSNADGLSKKSSIKISGVQIGEVSEILLDPKIYKAKVSMCINKDIQIPTDSSAIITSENILSEKYIKIDIGGKSEFLVEGDELFHTQSRYTSLDSIITNFISKINNN